MSAPWFHVEHVPDVGATVALDPRETRHATGARRLGDGDALCVFDGAGTVGDARIVESDAGQRHVVACVASRRAVPPPRPAIHLAVALPKGDRQATLLGMATQFGVASITPLACARSVAHATDKFTERAARVCLEACKQSRRAWRPEIRAAAAPADVAAPGALVADPSGRPAGEVLRDLATASPEAVTVLIGPEGGFTDDETAAMRAAGAETISLGAGILRIETAAVAVAATIRLLCEDGATLPPP